MAAMAINEGDVPASQLLSVLSHGTELTGKQFKTDEERQPSVAISGLNGAIFFEADLDIDCDGEPDGVCNDTTDPWFYPALSAGEGIHASETPFFVIPLTYDNNEIGLGSVGAVIYNNQLAYGVFLDECGVENVIGEASYAMAEKLGINPDPQNGGTDDPVTYIVFTGEEAMLSDNQYTDHNAAIEAGSAAARKLLESYNVTANRANRMPSGEVTAAARDYSIDLPSISVKSAGRHSVSLLNCRGQQLMSFSGEAARTYTAPRLTPGMYLVKITTPRKVYTQRAVMR
jgi:hypothetical protein